MLNHNHFQGHDTTAMGICFTLLLLAEHNEIQVAIKLLIIWIQIITYNLISDVKFDKKL